MKALLIQGTVEYRHAHADGDGNGNGDETVARLDKAAAIVDNG